MHKYRRQKTKKTAIEIIKFKNINLLNLNKIKEMEEKQYEC